MWNVHKGGVHFQTAHSWIGAHRPSLCPPPKSAQHASWCALCCAHVRTGAACASEQLGCLAGAFGLGLFALQWLVGFLVYLLPKRVKLPHARAISRRWPVRAVALPAILMCARSEWPALRAANHPVPGGPAPLPCCAGPQV